MPCDHNMMNTSLDNNKHSTMSCPCLNFTICYHIFYLIILKKYVQKRKYVTAHQIFIVPTWDAGPILDLKFNIGTQNLPLSVPRKSTEPKSQRITCWSCVAINALATDKIHPEYCTPNSAPYGGIPHHHVRYGGHDFLTYFLNDVMTTKNRYTFY